jgi:hypothetical protein
MCSSSSRGGEDDDGIAWGDIGYRFKPLELKTLNHHTLGMQQTKEAQRQRARQVRSIATVHTDPIFGSQQARDPFFSQQQAAA